MTTTIPELEPRALWRHFYNLTQIPRPSGHEQQIREYVADFGRRLGLKSLIDEAGNVIIRKPAKKGMEQRKGVILQAHLDMVPQKNADSHHDFERDPIEAYFEKGWVRARGTTLGADNGIGVAAALAVLESESLSHGPLEALFTANEEAGMTGAMGLKPEVLEGEILLNLDSEDEGELFIGCAGGLDGTMTFRYSEASLPPDYAGFEIRVSGLKGGHSGLDIHLGRGNANKIMNRLLQAGHDCCSLRLASIDGGSLRNAIPRESTSLVTLPSDRAELFVETLKRLGATIAEELAAVDPDLRIEIRAAEIPDTVIDNESFGRLLQAVADCPNGVVRMSGEMDGVVETSNNLARVKSNAGSIAVECLLRSSVDSSLEELATSIQSVADRVGATSSFTGGYPGWKPDPDSPILSLMQRIYQQRFGKAPEVKAIHAGLECGIIGGIYPGLDMISFGPTIRFPHSPDEKVECASVQKFWDFLVDVLADIPAK
ncbi:aminoacyl-histidine dipeptidase [Chlorobaculum parvum NCIB 8327]|uniref:Cytosol non-specific dipeptidase n=1 Tax=Chlorobaculum parvum (strain DSM 263 / NCIMB 8327) TaxID=517417 RepID=B3QNB8_CHLP8|nr:aminoacyl-histidine dipeptidase [Chlorobaculum parvum]ACF11421.1 aminoacyl-histidine dipeptidase [Chlorobaculum parvum NCIB 8327]